MKTVSIYMYLVFGLFINTSEAYLKPNACFYAAVNCLGWELDRYNFKVVL